MALPGYIGGAKCPRIAAVSRAAAAAKTAKGRVIPVLFRGQ